MNFERNEFILLAVVQAYEDFHLDWRLGLLTKNKENGGTNAYTTETEKERR